MHRRQFLSLTTAAAATVLLSQCSRRSPRITAPQRFVSQSGLLEAELTAQTAVVTVGGRRATLLSYNGQVPGPLLAAQPGDTLRLHLHNQLPQPTNLHYHGLHISPSGNADNVFLHVPPGESLTYEFTLPPDHPAGLAWYHPHQHGLVAEQIFSGLAAPILIRGGLDELPELQAATEALLVLQDFALNRRGKIVPPNPMFQRWGRQGDLITVNGQHRPRLTLPAEGLLRLRLLNASASRIYRLALNQHLMHLIATDGSPLAMPISLDELILAPGERAEVLIQGDQEPGEYALMNLPYDRGIMDMMGGMGMRAENVTDEPQPIAQISYGDRVKQPQAVPQQLLNVEPLPEPQVQREFVLDHGIDHRTGAPFLINGKAFEPGRIDTQVQVGSVEDWRIINRAGMDHPFHLHTNRFQVVSRNGQPVTDLAWKDVVSVPAYEEVVIRIRFEDYAGKTVYHCHILDHEDQGMMGIIEMQSSS
ncbi:multicopper oxidase family protein [Sphaerothrix gracilis]|uniref:multicopper oxidase family protein n=1 Tax=Sphaerothrix gracilis TaxID=3151835 RepID=UPI0031FD3BCF